MGLIIFFLVVFIAEYIALPKTYQIISEAQDANFLNEKARKYIEYVLYSYIQNDKQSSGTLHYNRYYSYEFDDKCLCLIRLIIVVLLSWHFQN